MSTLADLTLELSRAITRNEQERAAALAALEGERTTALAALPGAGALTQRRATALAQAETERAEALLDIETDLREAERLAAIRRRTEEDEAEQRLQKAEDEAEERRRAAEDKAKAAFETATLDIERRKLTPGEKVLARAEARRTMDRALAAARDALAEARIVNHDRLMDARRAAVDKELADSRDERAKAAGRRQAAEQAFELAGRTSDGALQAGLAVLPGAAALLAAFVDRRRGVDRRFDEQEALLYAGFRRARNQLHVG